MANIHTPFSTHLEKQNGKKYKAFRVPLCLCLFPKRDTFLFRVHIIKDPGPLLWLLDANEVQTTREAEREEICIYKQTEAHSAPDFTMLAINKYLKNTIIALYYQYISFLELNICES